MAEYGPQYCIYKPTKTGKGGAMRWQLDVKKQAVFVDAAAQVGEHKFDWEHKVVMKWGISDIGEVLAVIEKRVDSAELFHQTDSGTAKFSIRFQRDKKPANYFLQMWRKEAKSDQARGVALPLSQAEAATLCVLLRAATVRILKW